MPTIKSDPSFFWCSLPRDPATAAVVRHLQEQGLLVADHSLRRGARDIVAISDAEVQQLKDAGVPFEMIGPVGAQNGSPPRGTAAPPVANALASGFVTAYLDASQIATAVAALHTSFPTLTQLIDLPELTSGYDGSVGGLTGPVPVKLLRITTTPAVFSKPGILIVAGLHAREWAPPLAAIEFASQLLNNYAPGSLDPDVVAINELVGNLDILVVAAGNPDGINFSHHDDGMWRKNRRVNAGFPACPGVDNNRNFSIYWGQAGSSSSPCDYQVYRGPASFSEIENRNIRHIVDLFPNVLTAIDCHSFGEKFLRPQPTGGTFIASEPVPSADHTIYLALEAAMNAAVGTVTAGKSYSTGTTSNHAGTFDEYMYFGHRIFGFELEIGEDFQPLIADALVSAQEAAAAMRALAHETLALAARFTTPATIVQVIDKSSSMVASGYVDATLANAHRFIDLMGLNDVTATVSFNQTAATNLPLIAITAPGIYATAHAAVSGIAFGGSTSIGAGLQAALTAIGGAAAPRSILLLSDGYENTAPLVASILPSVPGDVHVHTVALGAASDQALLQSIATATGGSYFFSPDELGLFEIYNVARAASADNDLVLEETVDAPSDVAASAPWTFSRLIVIDDDAAYADFSVATLQRGVQVDVSIRPICPSVADLGRIQRRLGADYQVLRLRRPQPGTYEMTVTVHSGPTPCSVAAYVNSPIRLRLDINAAVTGLGRPIDVAVAVTERKEPISGWSVFARGLAPVSSLRTLVEGTKDVPTNVVRDRGDRLPELVTRGLAIRDALRRQTGSDPLRHEWRPVNALHPIASTLPVPGKAWMVLRAVTSSTVDGSYNVRVDVRGRSQSGHPFVRVGLRSAHRA